MYLFTYTYLCSQYCNTTLCSFYLTHQEFANTWCIFAQHITEEWYLKHTTSHTRPKIKINSYTNNNNNNNNLSVVMNLLDSQTC